MKRKILFLGLGLLALALSGCMDIETRSCIYPDGSGKNTVIFKMDPAKMVSMAGSFMGGIMPQGEKGAADPIKELEKTGIVGISELATTITLYYADIRQFKNKGIKELLWQKENKGYHLKMVYDLSQLQEKYAPELSEGTSEEEKQAMDIGRAMQMQMLKGMQISFVVIMPGKIVNSNGAIKGREARWEMTMEELMKKKDLTIEAFSESSSPELNAEFKNFKDELAQAQKKFKEMASSLQHLMPSS